MFKTDPFARVLELRYSDCFHPTRHYNICIIHVTMDRCRYIYMHTKIKLYAYTSPH